MLRATVRGENRCVPDGDDDGRTLDDPADARALAQYATTLADRIEQAIPGWIDRSVRRVLVDQGIPVDDVAAARIHDAGCAARSEGGRRVRALLSSDIDAQAGSPLAVLRSLVAHATAVLESTGARPVARDEFSERNFPEDVYDLTPASFAEVDPALHQPGLVWGAAKAHVHLARQRREGRR
jgi:hypothetical protein